MTDRIKGLTVAFEKDIKEDDVQSIINAICLIKGVCSVSKSVSDTDDWINRERIRNELIKSVYCVFKGE